MNQDPFNQGSSSGSDFFEEKKCHIFLRIFFRTVPNEEIRIAGNIPELGSWNIQNGFPMNTDKEMYPVWHNLKPLKVAKNTNIEFKIMIFENGKFREWEKLPNNGNRYHFIKFSKVCLEMREFIAEIRELAVAKFDSDNEIQISDGQWRKLPIGKKICPYELAKETDSESSDKLSELIGDMISPDNHESSSFMSNSKSLSESQSDLENDSDYAYNQPPARNPRGGKTSILVKAQNEKKSNQNFQEIYDKFIKNAFKSSKKKISQNVIRPSPSFFIFNSKGLAKSNGCNNEILVVLSLFPPIKVKKIKENNGHDSPNPKHNSWRVKPILDVFYADFYEHLISKNCNFYWFCWSGVKKNLSSSEQQDLTKFLQESYHIVPYFFESSKIQNFIENIRVKIFKQSFQNHIDLYSPDSEIKDLDVGAFNEVNKKLAKAASKFLANPIFHNTVRNFFVLNYHLMRVPFYLRKTILKSSKIPKPYNHNIAFYFPGGFPNPENIRFLGNYRKLLVSILFSDLLIFPVFDHARNFCYICQKYLGICCKTQEGGRLYFEFEGRILLINVHNPYIGHVLKQKSLCLNELETSRCPDYDLLNSNSHIIGSAHKGKTIESLCEEYHDALIITSLDKIDSSSMIEMKFQTFRSFAMNKTSKRIVLVELLYNIFEDSFVKNTEYIDKLTQMAHGINETLLQKHRIEVFYANKIPRKSLAKLYAQTSIFLKLSLVRDESYLHHLEYLDIKDGAVVLLSSNLFQSKAFKSILTITSLNMDAMQNALAKAELMVGERSQECLVVLDREYLRLNNIPHWLEYNLSSLQGFSFYHDKKFKLTLERSQVEGESLRLLPVTSSFEEFEVKQIANAYQRSENRVFVLDFEGVFLDVDRINAILNTNNVLEIENKLSKCKPSLTMINDETLSKFRSLVQNPKNSVYVISSLAHEKLVFFFPDMKDLTLFAENGYLCQRIGRDELPFLNFYEKADTSWKAIVQTVILEYVAKTEGSYLIEKKYSLIWVFDKVDREFAEIQAKELLDHLTEVLEFIDVIEIVKYETLIEVRLKNCHKGMGCVMAAYESYMSKGPIDFFLCVGGTRDFSSDLFLASKTLKNSIDQRIFHENISFFNCTLDPKNCNLNSDGYLRDIGEFHRLISQLGCEELNREFSKKHLGKGGVFKKMTFEEEQFEA